MASVTAISATRCREDNRPTRRSAGERRHPLSAPRGSDGLSIAAEAAVGEENLTGPFRWFGLFVISEQKARGLVKSPREGGLFIGQRLHSARRHRPGEIRPDEFVATGGQVMRGVVGFPDEADGLRIVVDDESGVAATAIKLLLPQEVAAECRVAMGQTGERGERRHHVHLGSDGVEALRRE